MRIKIWRQVAPITFVAFIAGYFFERLAREHGSGVVELPIWFGIFGTAFAVVGAFVLGEKQIAVLLTRERRDQYQHVQAKHRAYVEMIDASLDAITRLNDQYNDTREDRLRIRAAYHGDTFASLIEALAAIPMYELNSTDATIALAGFKKNMIEIQHLVDQFIADRNRRGADILFPSTIPMLDLRQYKAHVESHKQIFVNALKPID